MPNYRLFFCLRFYATEVERVCFQGNKCTALSSHKMFPDRKFHKQAPRSCKWHKVTAADLEHISSCCGLTLLLPSPHCCLGVLGSCSGRTPALASLLEFVGVLQWCFSLSVHCTCFCNNSSVLEAPFMANRIHLLFYVTALHLHIAISFHTGLIRKLLWHSSDISVSFGRAVLWERRAGAAARCLCPGLCVPDAFPVLLMTTEAVLPGQASCAAVLHKAWSVPSACWAAESALCSPRGWL